MKDEEKTKEQLINELVELRQRITELKALETKHKWTEWQLQQRIEQLQNIYHLSDAISHADTIEEIYEEALNALQRTLKTDRASVLLFDPDSTIRFKAWRGLSECYRKAVEGHSPWSPNEKNPQPILIYSAEEEPSLGALREVITDEGIHALGFIPLVYQGRLLGKFMIYYNTPHRFSEEEVQLARTIASYIAFAIERKQVEEGLRESEKQFRQIAENIGEVFWMTSPDKNQMIYISPSYEEIWGRTCKSLYEQPRSWLDSIHPEDREPVIVALEKQVRREYDEEYRIIQPGGSVRWIRDRAFPIRNELGEIYRIAGIATDITERKRAEEKIRQQNEYLAALHETALGLMNRLELDDLLEAILMRAGALVGTSHGFIRLVEPGETEMVVKVGVGVCSKFIGHRVKPGEGMNGKVWQTGQPLAVDDYRTWPDRLPDPSFDIFCAVVTVPLKSGSEVVGMIGLDYFEEGRTFGDNEIAILSRFAELASIALDNARLYAASQQELVERKRAEEALRKQQEEQQIIFDSVPAMIWYKDKENRILRINKPAAESIGLSVKEIEGKSTYELYPDEAAQYHEDDLKVINSGKPKTGIIEQLQTASGEKRWIQTDKIPYRDEEGNIVGVIVFASDITERKRAEEALAAEKERLAVTLRSIGDGVITTDTEGKIVLVNKAAETLTGWTQEEALGKPITQVFHILHEKTRQPCDDPVKQVLEAGRIIELARHTALIARDETERVIADNGAPIRDKDGKIIGVVLVFRDISEQRKLEEELLKAQKLESVGILAGGIAHDFNNILTATLLNISLAKMYAKPEEEMFKRLTEAEKASLRAKDLTQQLLTFSKGGAPVKKTASIVELIKDSASFVLRGSNVQCEFSIPEDLWPVEVDEGQMSQVIHNLVLNAQQAMLEGGTVKVWVENRVVGLEEEQGLPLQAGSYIKLSIADEGIGIPKEHLPKIFDPYFTTKQKGSGLGLATTYSIIKKHDGYIDVESELGIGTTFTVYLPVSQKGILAKEPCTGMGPEGAIKVSKGRVLIMDDEEMLREAAGQMLRVMGYEVEFATEGAEAVECYKRARESGQPFEVVILDLTIPGGMGGGEAIKRLAEMDPEVKAIVSSGYSNDPVMAEYRGYGFRGVIAKPYKIEELSQTLHKVIMGINE